MTMSPFAESSRLLAAVFYAPRRALRAVAERHVILPALLVATVATVIQGAVLVPRLDFEGAVVEQLARHSERTEMTPHEMDRALARGRKVGAIGTLASALVTPSLTALLVAFAFWLGVRVIGKKSPFLPLLAVTSVASLPTALRALLSLPAIIVRPVIQTSELPRLFPSNLAYFFNASRPIGTVLDAIVLFTLWSLALVVLGTTAVTGERVQRVAVLGVVLWVSYVAVFHFALPRLGGAPR